MNYKFIQVITIIVLGFNNCQHCFAQAPCNGVLTGIFYNGVTCVVGSNCTLDCAIVFGNVSCSTGTLLAVGNSFITDSVLLDGMISRAELDAVTVLGAVQVTDAFALTELVITEMACVGPVTVTNAPNAEVRVSGTLQGLDLDRSGGLIADNLMINATVSIKNTTGLVDVCGSFLGGLLVEQHTGNILINASAPSCDQITINGGLSVSKGQGVIRIIGASLPNSDLIFSEHTGNIILDDIPTVNDIKSERNSNSLIISNVIIESDIIIIGSRTTTLQGVTVNGNFSATESTNIRLENTNTAGDFIINEISREVLLRANTFAFKNISISQVGLGVALIQNTNLSLSVERVNGQVSIINNEITNGEINENTGGVMINDNIFTTLSCTGNVPAPTGTNNTITFGDGQCSSGLP